MTFRRHEREPRPWDEAAAKARFAKPQYIPKPGEIDTSTFALGKEKADRDNAYLDFVRGELCAAHGVDGIHCDGVTEAAHLIGSLGDKRSDYFCVPLCSGHHRTNGDSQHNIGLTQFQISHGVNLWETATRLLVRWVRRYVR